MVIKLKNRLVRRVKAIIFALKYAKEYKEKVNNVFIKEHPDYAKRFRIRKIDLFKSISHLYLLDINSPKRPFSSIWFDYELKAKLFYEKWNQTPIAEVVRTIKEDKSTAWRNRNYLNYENKQQKQG